MSLIFHPSILAVVLAGMVMKFADFVIATPLWAWALWMMAAGVACIVVGRKHRLVEERARNR